MAGKKSGGATKNLRDSNPKYLGVKISNGQSTQAGAIIVRQRGTRVAAGVNAGVGKDHTIFALRSGTVRFSSRRKTGFNGKIRRVTVVSIV